MGRTILITGGSRGIGRATAILAAEQGWQVALTYRADAAAAQETVAAVQTAGGPALAIAGDVTVEADVVHAFDAAIALFGRLDAVVVNAGIVAPSATLAEMTLARLERMFDTNILGAFLVAREAARRLPQATAAATGADAAGAIVFVSSAAARLGSPFEYVDYAASKGAIDTLTVGLAKELAPARIRVNAVRPGLIETDIHASGGQPDRAQRLGATVPMARPGTAAEVAHAILWLCGTGASYATGAILDIAGGR
ncbi:MAG: SDR family oxidoreductase [Pseudomonadota bacterium]